MRYLVKLMCRFFVAPAVVGEVQVSRGRAIFGEVEASIVMGGAVFGALFRGIWNDGQRETLYFRKENVGGQKLHLPRKIRFQHHQILCLPPKKLL